MEPAIQELIQKYLQGEATPEEQAIVEQYYRSFAEKKPYTPFLDSKSKKSLEEKIYEGILQKINPGLVLEEQPEPVFDTTSRTFYLSVAASFIGLVTLAFSYFILFRSDKVILSTGYGEVATFTLPDNSKVTLNGNSTLEYIPWTSNQNREVTLQGEAFFSVQHTKNHQKFLVHVPGKMQVEVLGTEFNVTGRQNNTRVVLSSGKVRLRLPSTKEEVIMAPGEMAEFKSWTTTTLITKTKVNPEKYTSWSGRMLVLDKTTLRDLVNTLENTYGLQVTVPDTSLLRHTFSGRVPKQDVEILLLGLNKAFDLQIIKKGKQVTIQKQ